jgi:tRNA nucleotidyltransferase (CCA-adding enzyme)
MSVVDADLGRRIAALPGMDALLPALEGLPPVFLVGGAVRDLLLEAEGVDLDLAVEGDAVAAADVVAERLGGEVRRHERFGTATVVAADVSADLATTRRERYPRPGALPEVEPAPLAEDLARRDFTINAMAAALMADELGRLLDPHAGLTDLRTGALRVLHYRSFEEDPTRLLRAVRYELRLGFAMEDATERWAREAAESGAPATVSGPRIREGLMALLALPDPAAAASRMRSLGLDRALHPALVADPELVGGAVRGADATGAQRVLAALAALVAGAPDALHEWLDRLGLPASDRDRVIGAARRGPELAQRLAGADPRPSELHALLADEPLEALALALAHGAPEQPVLHYLEELRTVGLEITGDDLLAAGVAQSPAVGRALAATLRLKLDGEVSGPEEELEAALRLAGEER